MKVATPINPISAARLKEILCVMHLSQQDLANAIDVSLVTINAILNERKPLTPRVAELITEKFPVINSQWLLGLSDNRNNSDGDTFFSLLCKVRELSSTLTNYYEISITLADNTVFYEQDFVSEAFAELLQLCIVHPHSMKGNVCFMSGGLEVKKISLESFVNLLLDIDDYINFKISRVIERG